MALNDTSSSDYWNYLFVDLAGEFFLQIPWTTKFWVHFSSDPRTNDWPLIKSPVPGLMILATYLYFINSLGPRLMANRKPFNLEKTLIVYNLIQVIVSSWLVFESLDAAWLRHYSWRCQPVDHSRSPQAFRVSYFWLFYGNLNCIRDLFRDLFVLRSSSRKLLLPMKMIKNVC